MNFYTKIDKHAPWLSTILRKTNDLSTLLSEANKEVNSLIPHLERKIHGAKNEADIMLLLQEVDKFQRPIAYSNSFLYLITALGASTSFLSLTRPEAIVDILGLSSETVELITIAGPSIGLPIAILGTLSAIYRAGAAEKLSDLIFAKDIQMDNFFQKMAVSNNTVKPIKTGFQEFKVSDDLVVTALYKGTFSDTGYGYKLMTCTNGDGKSKAKRYGVIIENLPVSGLILAPKSFKRPKSHVTHNNKRKTFNNKLVPSSANGKFESKLINDKRFIDIVNDFAQGSFHDLLIEFNDDGTLLISFTTEHDPFSHTPKRRYNVNKLEAFKREIKGHRRLKHFDEIGDFQSKLVELFEKI